MTTLPPPAASLPRVVLGTPRKLPRADALPGRVVVLDIAFAAAGTGASFEKVTGPFLKGLGDRLARWVDHHDHAYHPRYAEDRRFVLATKAQHGACPEMVTADLVADTGPVDTVVCHNDFDGLYAAAKWLRGGAEPYPGADDDARAVDTRMGTASARGDVVDRALRVYGREEPFQLQVVDWLVAGAPDGDFATRLAAAAAEYSRIHDATEALAAERYELHGAVAVCDVGDVPPRQFDKTALLLLGQQRAPVSVVLDAHNVTLAAAFDSGIDFLALLRVGGGMPTRVSVPRSREGEVVTALQSRGLWR
jgi:hypothetical protein